MSAVRKPPIRPRQDSKIRSFTTNTGLTKEKAAEMWALLEQAIEKIQQKEQSQLSFEELYRTGYTFVIHKQGEFLYNNVQATLERYMEKISLEVEAAKDGDFLLALNARWQDHKRDLVMIRDILMYLDRNWLQERQKTSNTEKCIYDLGLLAFRTRVVEKPTIKDHLTAKLLEMVAKERANEVIKRSEMKDILAMLYELTPEAASARQVYEAVYEKPYLETSANYYKVQSAEYLANSTAASYLKKAEEWIEEELARVDVYMEEKTKPKIKAVLERELIAQHVKAIIEMENTGMVNMLEDDRHDELSLMYTLFGRVAGGHESMCNCIGKQLREKGKGIVLNEDINKDPPKFAQALLELKDKYDVMWEKSFASDQVFRKHMNQAFQDFINLYKRSPENIALYADRILKNGNKEGENDIDTELERTIVLFRFLQNKDEFQDYYRRHLMKRLLHKGSSFSEDREQIMIRKLQMENGVAFVKRLETMFKDIKMAEEDAGNFRSYMSNLAAESVPDFDFTVSVLTSNAWPLTLNEKPMSLPPELQKAQEVYVKYYENKHANRQLKWALQQGTAELKAQFKRNTHTLVMSTQQMVVLVLFNDAPEGKLTLETIVQKTDISMDDGKRIMSSLLKPAKDCKPLLIKSGEKRVLAPTDEFEINSNFMSKSHKVRLPPVGSLRETDTERKETQKKITEDRSHELDASIVRLMKARKRLEHNILVQEVTAMCQARFVPDPKAIKDRIALLIDKEYLKRDTSNMKIYEYVA